MRIPEWLQDPMSIGRRRILLFRRIYLVTTALVCVVLAIFADPVNQRIMWICAGVNLDTFRRTFYDNSI